MSPELGRRIAFTLGALLVYRLGSYIPLPGIDLGVWAQIYNHSTHMGGTLGLYNAFSGGGLHRLAIFALGILPYITAAALMQIAVVTVRFAFNSSWFPVLSQQGNRGRRKFLAYTRLLTLALAALQSLSIAEGLERVPGVVAFPGGLFELSTVLTLTAGTLLLAWIADQITARGIGNGVAVILAAGFITGLPPAIAGTLELGRQGVLSTELILGMAALAVGVVALIVFVEGARRRIMIDYPQRAIGGRTIEAVSAPLALKLNNAGMAAAVFVAWFIFLPAVVASFTLGPSWDWFKRILNPLNYGPSVLLVLSSALIVVFCLFYTAFLLDPEKACKTLEAHGGVVRGVAPGEPSMAYFDYVISRITIVGGLYLAFVFIIIPELLIRYFGVPFYMGGQFLLVVVCTILDIGAQYRHQMQLQPGGYSR